MSLSNSRESTLAISSIQSTERFIKTTIQFSHLSHKLMRVTIKSRSCLQYSAIIHHSTCSIEVLALELQHFKGSLCNAFLKSTLSDRHQFISINNCKSTTVHIPHGVPQGSMLGPLLFILYIQPLGEILLQIITTLQLTPSSPPAHWT